MWENMENMTPEELQQKIDSMTNREVIMIYGRIYRDSKFPDFWKIDHSLNGYYTVSGPDFLVFGEKLEVRKTGEGSFDIKIANETNGLYDLVGYVYLKNVYQVNVIGPVPENTTEASA